MGDLELESIKAQWGKVYEAVKLRGEPDGFSYHFDIARLVSLRDNVLTLTIPQVEYTPIELEWRDMMRQCACGSRQALAEAIQFITGEEVRVEFESYDGSRRTEGFSDAAAADFLTKEAEERQRKREEEERNERAQWQPIEIEKVQPSQTFSVNAELIPPFLEWPGTGSGRVTISPQGAVRFSADDGIVTELGAISRLVAGYQIDREGNVHLNFSDVKIVTAGMLPVSMLKIYVPAGQDLAALPSYLSFWGLGGERQTP